MSDNYYITDKADIFFFYKIIEHTKATHVLDMGVFFERTGAISRQIGDAELPRECMVDGFCADEEGLLPVYEEIYDHVFYEDTIKRQYELAILLSISGIDKNDRIINAAKDVSKNTKYMALDDESYRIIKKSIRSPRMKQDIMVEGKRYWLLEYYAVEDR